MAATNIFYRIPSQRGTKVASIAGTECTLDQFCNYIIDIEGLNRQDFIIASGTKVFRPSSCNLQLISLQNNSNVDILIPLLGGKGGFGSLLRAIGAQIEKTTNRDACRDLSGRRLRDVKREAELKKLLELQAKLMEERKRRKKEKLENLRKKSEVSKTSASIQELVSLFDDHAFNKRRLELSDIIDAAVEKGLINSKRSHKDEEACERGNGEAARKRLRPEMEPTSHESDSRLADSGDDITANKLVNDKTNNIISSVSQDLKKETKKEVRGNIKKTDLWLGLEEDDDDDEVEDEDEDEAKVAVNN